MLILTEAAAVAVKSVTSTSQASEDAGLRIASSVPQPREPGALQPPGQGDQVIEAAGARVFVEPQAAAYLDDKVLDAQIDAEGKARFSLGVQPSGQA
jgi:Fe-S cluster assembly iron-binding protein IscA